MARAGKGLYAPSGERRAYRVYQVYDVFLCGYTCWRGCRRLTCLHGTQIPSGVQVPPKLPAKVKPWNVETPSLRLVQRWADITVRRVVGAAGLRG